MRSAPFATRNSTALLRPIFGGPEEGIAPVFGRGVVEESADGVEVAEAGGGGQIDSRAAGGEEFGCLRPSVGEAGGDEGRLFERRAAVEEGLE